MQDTDLDLVKKCYEDKEVTINSVTYKMLDITNQQAFDIIGASQELAATGAILNSPAWKKLESRLFNVFMIDNSMLSKLPRHFEEYRGNYLTFVNYAVAMVSYPFQSGGLAPIG